MLVVVSLKYFSKLMQAREFRILYVSVLHAFAIVLAIGAQFGLGRTILSSCNYVCPTWNRSSGLLISSELSPRQLSQWLYHGDSILVRRTLKEVSPG